jgi:ADP-ribosylglycohydrolase
MGDALAMPVHWYYDPTAIPKDYGGAIKDFKAPKEPHPSSIMSLSNTGGAGRGGKAGSIIGDVINHGKKHFWGPRGTHYHHGMAAGENTLNAITARVVMRAYTQAGACDVPLFLQEYVKFMTTPGSHNDTYAESYHRMFFANWVAKKPLDKCADDDQHNIASMGGMVNLPPAAVFASVATAGGSTEAHEAAGAAAVAQMYATHNSETLAGYAQLYGALLSRLVHGQPLREALLETAAVVGMDLPGLTKRKLKDTQVIGQVYSSACYIEHSFPCLLYLAYKYSDSPEAALVANTNAGGENVHRGAALGALMGAAHGSSAWPQRWHNGLVAKDAIATEVSAFLAAAGLEPEGEVSSSIEVGASGQGNM